MPRGRQTNRRGATPLIDHEVSFAALDDLVKDRTKAGFMREMDLLDSGRTIISHFTLTMV